MYTKCPVCEKNGINKVKRYFNSRVFPARCKFCQNIFYTKRNIFLDWLGIIVGHVGVFVAIGYAIYLKSFLPIGLFFIIVVAINGAISINSKFEIKK